MSYRIFNSVDLVVVIDTVTWDVQKFPLDNIWYQYNNIEAPILYSIYQIDPERPIILDQPYTAFQDKDGNKFGDDLSLASYLDNVLGRKEISAEYTVRGNDRYLKTSDISNEILLTDILLELKKINVQLSLITDETILSVKL